MIIHAQKQGRKFLRKLNLENILCVILAVAMRSSKNSLAKNCNAACSRGLCHLACLIIVLAESKTNVLRKTRAAAYRAVQLTLITHTDQKASDMFTVNVSITHSPEARSFFSACDSDAASVLCLCPLLEPGIALSS